MCSMGNNQGVPRDGGGRLLFQDITNNADHLVMDALDEEQKEQQNSEEKHMKRVKERFQTGSKNEENVSRNEEKLLENFKPRENEFTEARRLHGSSSAKREKFKSDNPYSRQAFEKWRNHQEKIISSVRATMADRRERSALYQNGEIPPMKKFSPRRNSRSGYSPVFQYNAGPNFDLRRNKRDTPAPWSHQSYDNEQWVQENVIRWVKQNENIWSNGRFDPGIDDNVEDLTGIKEHHKYMAVNELVEADKKRIHVSSGEDQPESQTEPCDHIRNNSKVNDFPLDTLSCVKDGTKFDVLDVSNHVENVKDNFDERFLNIGKQKKDTSISEERLIPAHSLLEVNTDENASNTSLEKVNNHNRNNKYPQIRTKYGSIEHNDKIQSENDMKPKRLGEIQKNNDSWKTNESNCPKHSLRENDTAPRPSQYGSAAHYNLVKRDNALRKQTIDSATNKVDSWETNGSDDNSLPPHIRQKTAQYGSIEHNIQLKNDSVVRKEKHGNITTTPDTWQSKQYGNSLQHSSIGDNEIDKRPAEYGSIEHNTQIKRDNAIRKSRISKIQSNLDTWNVPDPESKYSLKRKEEWEPILDPGKYGSVDHFEQVKSENAMRKRHLSTIHSNLDTWNVPDPGTKYSLKRKDEWEPVYNAGKYGTVAHYHQVQQTYSDIKKMLKKTRTKLCTWQRKSKMNLLENPHQKKIETINPNMEALKITLDSVRPRIDTGRKRSDRRNDHSISSWSRNVQDNSMATSESTDSNL